MIKIDDIIAFVKKAMKKNLVILDSHMFKGIRLSDIQIYTTEKYVYITTPAGNFKVKFLNESEKLKFNLLIEEVKAYEEERSLEYFNNFFKEEAKVKDINDLDNDDD